MSSTKMETSQHKHEASTKDIKIEAVVLVALDRRSKMATPRRKGTVRYVGKAGTSNTWLGIELDEKYGKHDGKARNATYYFQCKMGHGIYVRPWHVVQAFLPARSIPERVGGVDSSSSSSPSSTAPSTSMTASTSSSSSKTSSLKQRETVAQLIASVQSLSSIADVKKVQSACNTMIQQLEVAKQKRTKATQQSLVDRRIKISRVYSTIGPTGSDRETVMITG